MVKPWSRCLSFTPGGSRSTGNPLSGWTNMDYDWGCGTGKMKPKLWNLEDRFLCVTLAVLQLALWMTLASNWERSDCLCILSAGIKGVHHHHHHPAQTPSSFCPSFTPAVEFKEKGKKGKAVHFAEMDGSASERLTDKRFASRNEKSVKALEKRCQQGNVTLDDVKFVALLFLQDTEMQRICSFTTFMRNKNLDSFLMALLYYLSYYLEKISMEKKPQSYMVGLVEKKEMELVISKLEDAQKYLAQKYCFLVLGVGMADKHHMNCGKEKMSDTQKDWKFFESFYTFCTCIAWIVFRRQYLTEIEEEVGRLFRTNMFNIPRRRREDEESGGEKKRMTLVQFRKMMAKRPAIKKAVDMRSPVLSTLLPSLREKAQNIVEKKHVAGIKHPPQTRKETGSLDSTVIPVVGILGEPRHLFNPHTLFPLESEENGKQTGRNSSVVERTSMDSGLTGLGHDNTIFEKLLP